MKTNSKIKNQQQIISIVRSAKSQGRKIVTFNGSFDLLHAGHVHSLEEAKSLGDILIVLLNSDLSIQSYKGVTRPIIGENNRAFMLSALACVDFVVLFNEINSKAILSKIKPDIHCNGADWGKNCVERSVVEKNGGIIHILSWQHGLSTSKIIEKILKIRAKSSKKALFIDRKFASKNLFRIKNFKIYFTVPINSVKKQGQIFIEKARRSAISLNDSWVVSESENLIVAGREVNAKTIKIGDVLPLSLKLAPHYYAKNLRAARLIIQNYGKNK